MLKQYLEIGKIVSTHGIRGEIRVQPWCDSPKFLCSFKTLYLKNGEEKVRVISARANKNMAVLLLDGVDNIDKANQLRGSVLYMDRQDAKLEDGVYFIQDIIGMNVYDIDSDVLYGEITDVLKTGKNDVYEITDLNNKKYLIPAIGQVIIKEDIEDRKMYIKPIKGIFDDEN